MLSKKFTFEEDNTLKNLKSIIFDKEVLVISCGPSIARWKEVYDEYPVDEKPFIICIKQSLNFVGQLCDLHVINEVNLMKYCYTENRPKVFFGIGNYETRDFSFVTRDVTYSVRSTEDLFGSVAGRLASGMNVNINFKDFFGFTSEVEWGPGIMYECVLPFLIGCKPKSITTIGWDIADSSGINTHHVEIENSKKAKFNIFLSQVQHLKIAVAKFLMKNKYLIKLHDFYRNMTLRIKYHMGVKLNSVSMIEGEAAVVSHAIPYIESICRDNDIKLRVLSESVWIKKSQGCP